jgi:HlyD family secretion protein
MRIHVLCFCALAIVGCAKKEEPEEKPVVAVKVAKAELSDLPLTVTAPATIFPREQANIAARLAAPIRELRVKKGDAIKTGQVLALLENRDVLAQRQEAESALADAQANLQKMTGGSIPTEIGRAEGQVATTKAALDQAQKNFDRRQALFQQGAIPNRDLLQSQTELATAKANYEVAVRALELLRGQSREADINSAKARVGQAEAKLANVRANLQFMELRAPFNGTVTEQFQYPGDMAQPSSPVYTVMDLSTVTARAQVPEANARGLKQGQACEFTSGDTPASSVPGRITVINRAVDPQRRTVEVWCHIDRPPAALRAGVFGNVVIHTGQISQAVTVPLSAVQLQEGTSNGEAFVVDSQRIAHKREVEIGETSNGRIEIRKGVGAGELVIIEGGYGLPDKTEVTLPGDKKESPKG